MTKILTTAMVILSVTSALCLAPQLAFAASSRHKQPHVTKVAAPPASKDKACIPMCDKDDSPCDPIYFKTADGRCKLYIN